ncbi:MAG TPA: aspartyl protease family protein [Candidatus Eremiobacteraceae bacterium]|nr:aspartyl protease family protein [Candidatus Eremiobacteraceae bacterium]
MSNFKVAAGALLVPGLILVFSVGVSAAPNAQASAVIRKSADAMGVAALHGVRTMRIDAAVSAVGLSGTGSQWLDLTAPRFAEHASLLPLVQDDGYDGNVVWSRDRSGLVWNDGSDAGRSTEIDTAYAACGALWRPDAAGASVTSAGTQSDKGRTYDVLSVVPSGSKLPIALWFDHTTHMLSREIVVNGPQISTTTLSDYRRVGGAMFPFAVHTETSDGNSSDSKVTRVVMDPPGADQQLQRPASAAHDFSMANGATSTTVPFTLHENHVYLHVMLNGKGPYLFIFDTGGANIIDPQVAQEIGALGKGNLQGTGVGAATESFSFADVDTLQVGDADLRHQLFAVVPVRAGFGVSTGMTVDGLIGWEVLARYITSFNYGENQVVLTLPGSGAAPADAHVIPFVFAGTQPQIACTIDAIPSECAIDTGARDSLTLFGPFVADHPEVVPQAQTAVGINGFGVGGPSLGKLGRLHSIGIADLQLSNLIADYTAQTQGAFAAPFMAANLGGNLLRRFDVTFDYDKQTMTLVPNAAFNDPDQYERSGLFLVTQSGKIIVANARPGTPAADAGIGRGDVITTIDGSPIGSMTLEAVRAIFTKPAGTVIHLGLTAKDGTQRTATLTLRDYV